MSIIKTIDLWTEQIINHQDVISGAFVDGFENDNIPFNSYKVIKNCNCIITTDKKDLNICNKHNAIIFYRDNKPVRLLVMNKQTNVDKCINDALNQLFNKNKLGEIYKLYNIKRTDYNLNQKAIINGCDFKKEIDVGSCDRPSLLEKLLEGSYTENNTNYGKRTNDLNYTFITNINIKYELVINDECFIIQHHCAFINKEKTRIIILQDDSFLNINEIINKFSNK